MFPDTGLSVAGVGEALTQPDIAYVTLTVERVNESLARALNEAARAMESLTNRLLQSGIQREDLKTTQFSAEPRYERQDDRTVLVGYRVSNSMTTTILGIDRIGSIIDEAVEAGSNRVENLRFATSRLAELKEQAREIPMINARQKADQPARLSGVSLGRVTRIKESDTSAPFTRDFDKGLGFMPSETRVPIEPGQLEIRTEVRVTWEMV